MSDIGDTKEELELKIAEHEHSIKQKELALNSIILDRKRTDVKLAKYKQSEAEIKEQIQDHLESIEALNKVIKQDG